LIGVIAAHTGLTVAQVREEQQQRAAGPSAAPAVVSGIQEVPG
jgi:hypothetical protein